MLKSQILEGEKSTATRSRLKMLALFIEASNALNSIIEPQIRGMSENEIIAQVSFIAMFETRTFSRTVPIMMF